MIRGDMHLHSSFSDGESAPEEIVREAIRVGYREIAITDHVRRTTDWLDNFCKEMNRLKQIYTARIKLYSGIEAKVINLKGDVDARPEFFKKVDLVLGAFHRIPRGEDEYQGHEEILQDKGKTLEYWFEGIMKLLENSSVMIIAHPTAILKSNSITVPTGLKKDIARKAAEHGKIFEVNTKYQVPDDEFIGFLKLYGVKLSFGSDSHSIEEMRMVATKNNEKLAEYADYPVTSTSLA